MTLTAWWFEGHGSKGQSPVAGITHTVEGQDNPGLIASVRVLDALQPKITAPLWQVELSGKIVGDTAGAIPGGSCAATARTYLRLVEFEPVLEDFARACSEHTLHPWQYIPPHVAEYIDASDKTQRAAGAAWSALRNVCYATAEAFGKSSGASSNPTGASFRQYCADRNAAWAAQNAMLERLLLAEVQTMPEAA